MNLAPGSRLGPFEITAAACAGGTNGVVRARDSEAQPRGGDRVLGRPENGMKVVILCGGKGVRAYPFTEHLPKPMLPVDGSPILVHIIKNFIAQGFHEFVLAAGYKKRVLDDYFENKNLGARIEIVDTGADRDTGGRIEGCKHLVGDTFVATYGDGLCDLALTKLLDFHRSHGRLATVTVAPLITQYGVLEAESSGRVTAMREKPVMHGHWINIGFMVFEKQVFERWGGENLERDVLPQLARDGELYMHRHQGFFKSMDSFKEQQELEELVHSGHKPWLG
jgi:glucose-1-phosphate cytidylyltransferase